MKRKYVKGFYVEWNEKTGETGSHLSALSNSCVPEKNSGDDLNLLPVNKDKIGEKATKQYPRTKSAPGLHTTKKVRAETCMQKKHPGKKCPGKTIQRRHQPGKKNYWYEILDNNFLFWVIFFFFTPVLVLVLLIREFWPGFLYSLAWVAGMFCLFYFIPVLWISFLLWPLWGLVSFGLGLLIYASVD